MGTVCSKKDTQSCFGGLKGGGRVYWWWWGEAPGWGGSKGGGGGVPWGRGVPGGMKRTEARHLRTAGYATLRIMIIQTCSAVVSMLLALVLRCKGILVYGGVPPLQPGGRGGGQCLS